MAQSAAASFNPSRTIMDQVVETAQIHSLMPRAEAERKAVALFRELALPDPDTIGQRYPHQVSGGQLQRLMAAMALITDPDLVIFDEPTTALDVTTQIEVLHAFRRVVRERKTTAVYVTHDLAVVAQMADRILVLRDGAQREIGRRPQIIGQPQDDYTQEPDRGRRPEARAARRRRPRARRRCSRFANLVAGYGAIDKQGMPASPVTRRCQPAPSRGPGHRRDRRVGLRQDHAGARRGRPGAPASGQVLFDGKPLAADVAAAQRARSCAASRSCSRWRTRR